MSNLYPKIPSPFARHVEGDKRNQLDSSRFSSPEIEFLAKSDWIWTPKLDGMNLRVMWDGYSVRFGGRTDKAVLPDNVLDLLIKAFPEEIIENRFGETPVTFFGEGIGDKIQKNGGAYGEPHFVLFDVKAQNTWLGRNDVTQIAIQIGVPFVPVVGIDDIDFAISVVQQGFHSGLKNDRSFDEGIVGTPELGFLDRRGHRIMVKIKHEDFYGKGIL